ncbi:unnamed protein product [Lactuca saligna]|uniref:Uncharacterized protein n=1 Tax=Lactuca saligna TaxID=75948 RepID=A0AA35Y8Q3_LACSI|nr:unnamed protein product [Lactuca saligna]
MTNPISTSRKPGTPHKIWFNNEHMGQIKSVISNFKTPPSAVTLGEVWRPLNGSMGEIVYIWVGQTSGEDDDNLWQIVGDNFIFRKRLATSSIVQIVKEYEEPKQLWKHLHWPRNGLDFVVLIQAVLSKEEFGVLGPDDDCWSQMGCKVPSNQEV